MLSTMIQEIENMPATSSKKSHKSQQKRNLHYEPKMEDSTTMFLKYICIQVTFML